MEFGFNIDSLKVFKDKRGYIIYSGQIRVNILKTILHLIIHVFMTMIIKYFFL